MRLSIGMALASTITGWLTDRAIRRRHGLSLAAELLRGATRLFR